MNCTGYKPVYGARAMFFGLKFFIKKYTHTNAGKDLKTK